MKLEIRQKNPTYAHVIRRLQDRINRAAVSEVRAIARSVERSFESTAKTFKENKPEFYRKEEKNGSDLTIIIGTENEIYSYLNYGTKIRWAVMTNNFEAKTKPGRIGAKAGRGRAKVRGRRAMIALGLSPKPGIEARNFDKQIVKNRFGKPGWEEKLAHRIVNKL